MFAYILNSLQTYKCSDVLYEIYDIERSDSQLLVVAIKVRVPVCVKLLQTDKCLDVLYKVYFLNETIYSCR